ncbi:hypothetical protein BHE74_00038899 [Ensete ventricosum]|nr:hypothetical protein BHE74_00038899 [Ensete ventricosum]
MLQAIIAFAHRWLASGCRTRRHCLCRHCARKRCLCGCSTGKRLSLTPPLPVGTTFASKWLLHNLCTRANSPRGDNAPQIAVGATSSRTLQGCQAKEEERRLRIIIRGATTRSES